MLSFFLRGIALKVLSENPNEEALESWVWATHSKEEIAVLRDSGKYISYNIGEVPLFSAIANASERSYALDILKRETKFAVKAGAKKSFSEAENMYRRTEPMPKAV